MKKMNPLICAVFLMLLIYPLAAQAPGTGTATGTAATAGTGTTTGATASSTSLSGVQAAMASADTKIDDQLKQMGITSTTCAPNQSHFDFYGPTFLVLLIVCAGLVLFYLAGNFFDSPQLIAIAKQEIFELIHTVLIVVFFLAFISFATITIFSASTPQGTPTPGVSMMDAAMNYSGVMVHKITRDLFWLAAFNTVLYMLYSAPLKLGGAVYMALHFNLGGVIKPFIDAIGSMASLLSFALGEWIANLSILCFIKQSVPSILLPVGVLLKSFPQTRGGGNAIIAICVALLFVYPTMLWMNSMAYEYRYGSIVARSSMQEALNGFMFDTGLGNLALYAIFLRYLTGMYLGVLFLSESVALLLDLGTDAIYTVFVLSIFLPLLNIFVTLTFAREIAKFFGTEINISAFTKLI